MIATVKKKRKPRAKTDEQYRQELQSFLTKRGPNGLYEGDPTAERIAKAVDAGERIIARIHYTTAGFEAGFHWEISPVIDELKRRGTITGPEHEAALRFMRNWYLGLHRGAPTSKFQPRLDSSQSGLDAQEFRWQNATLARKAASAVDPILRPALAWLIRALGDALPIRELGRYYNPDKSDSTLSAQGGIVLKLTCAQLAAHYGIDGCHISAKRIRHLSQILLGTLDGR